MQVPAGVPQQQVILQQQPMAAMNPYQQQVYWQQYYPQWTAVPAMQISQTSVQTQQPKLIQPPLPETSMAKPPLPPDSSGVGINPAPPVEPPKEEKPPLPPEPPPPEPTPPALPTVIALDFVISIAFSLFMNIYKYMQVLGAMDSMQVYKICGIALKKLKKVFASFCREKKLKSYPIYKLKLHSGNSSSNSNNSGRSINKIYMRTNNSYNSGNNSTRLVFDIKSILKSRVVKTF